MITERTVYWPAYSSLHEHRSVGELPARSRLSSTWKAELSQVLLSLLVVEAPVPPPRLSLFVADRALSYDAALILCPFHPILPSNGREFREGRRSARKSHRQRIYL